MDEYRLPQLTCQRGIWHVDYDGSADAEDIMRLFGTTIIPTAYPYVDHPGGPTMAAKLVAAKIDVSVTYCGLPL